MGIRFMDIGSIQPTDFPSKDSVDFFDSLTAKEIVEREGLPQVVWFPEGPLLSDGNNRSYVFFSRGHFIIAVDYKNEQSMRRCPFILNYVLEKARKIRRHGIRSIYDFDEGGVFFR